MGPTVGKVLLEIVKALGKAVVAGVGVELARAASGHVQKRFGPKKEDKKPEEMTPEELRKENERLRSMSSNPVPCALCPVPCAHPSPHGPAIAARAPDRRAQRSAAVDVNRVEYRGGRRRARAEGQDAFLSERRSAGQAQGQG